MEREGDAEEVSLNMIFDVEGFRVAKFDFDGSYGFNLLSVYQKRLGPNNDHYFKILINL